jgi:hypothetical protein
MRINSIIVGGGELKEKDRRVTCMLALLREKKALSLKFGSAHHSSSRRRHCRCCPHLFAIYLLSRLVCLKGGAWLLFYSIRARVASALVSHTSA